MYRYEGAPFISQYNQFTPWAEEAQTYVAGADLAANYEAVDEQKTEEKQFKDATPAITDHQSGHAQI